MSRLIIETYWTKVEPAPTGKPWPMKPIHGEYELKNTVSYPVENALTMKDQIKRSRTLRGFQGVFDGKIKMDLGRSYGIHSYQLVYLDN